jgi:hypothetical protein
LPAAEASYDWGHNVISLVLGAYLIGTLALRTFLWREPRGSLLPRADP